MGKAMPIKSFRVTNLLCVTETVLDWSDDGNPKLVLYSESSEYMHTEVSCSLVNTVMFNNGSVLNVLYMSSSQMWFRRKQYQPDSNPLFASHIHTIEGMSGVYRWWFNLCVFYNNGVCACVHEWMHVCACVSHWVMTVCDRCPRLSVQCVLCTASPVAISLPPNEYKIRSLLSKWWPNYAFDSEIQLTIPTENVMHICRWGPANINIILSSNKIM